MACLVVDACRYLGALIVGAVNGAGKEELLSKRFSAGTIAQISMIV